MKKDPAAAGWETAFCAVSIGISLLAGACLYALDGRASYLGEWIAAMVSLPEIPRQSGIWTFLRNWGADFLWAYALYFALYLSMGAHPSARMRAAVWGSVCMIFVESLQLIQIPHLRCGTFDILDMVAGGIATGIAVLQLSIFQLIHRRRRDNEQR